MRDGKKDWVSRRRLFCLLLLGQVLATVFQPSSATDPDKGVEPTIYVVNVYDEDVGWPLDIEELGTGNSLTRSASGAGEVVCGGDRSLCEEATGRIIQNIDAVGRVWIGPTRFSISATNSCEITVVAMRLNYEVYGDLDTLEWDRISGTKQVLASAQKDGESVTCEAVWPPED